MVQFSLEKVFLISIQFILKFLHRHYTSDFKHHQGHIVHFTKENERKTVLMILDDQKPIIDSLFNLSHLNLS